MVDALGIAGSMASGIIEYLAEGAWTKRMHAGWAAQSGLRAALLARAASTARAPCSKARTGSSTASRTPRRATTTLLIGDFGTRWVTETLAFKPYPCGTMTHPYIDCARRLAARGIKAADIKEMVCEVGEGTVHRLWEPLAAKQRPPNGYAGEILARPTASRPASCAAMSGLTRSPTRPCKDAGACSRSPAKVRYVIDPQNPYPNNFTGHIRAVLRRRQRDRGAPAAHPRRRARAADARRHRGQVRALRRHGGWDEPRIEQR